MRGTGARSVQWLRKDKLWDGVKRGASMEQPETPRVRA